MKNLKDLIDDFRNNNNDKEKYSLILQKLVDMYNNDELLYFVSKMGVKNGELDVPFVSKEIEKEQYLLVFTEDADLFGKGDTYSFVGVKVRNVFKILLTIDYADGLLFNMRDESGDVLLTKNLVEAILSSQ